LRPVVAALRGRRRAKRAPERMACAAGSARRDRHGDLSPQS